MRAMHLFAIKMNMTSCRSAVCIYRDREREREREIERERKRERNGFNTSDKILASLYLEIFLQLDKTRPELDCLIDIKWWYF